KPNFRRCGGFPAPPRLSRNARRRAGRRDMTGEHASVKGRHVWRASRFLAAFVVALGALAAPGAAQNPRLSLKLENLTAADAAARLGEAAGVSLNLAGGGQAGAPAPGAARLQERASFDWTGVTFAQALRQLCERYGLRVGFRNSAGYPLAPAGAP